MGQYFMMFKTVCLSLLITTTFSLPHAKHDETQKDRGFILDILGGIVAGDGTTPSPAESTTMATLYGDLVNIFNLIFAPPSSSPSKLLHQLLLLLLPPQQQQLLPLQQQQQQQLPLQQQLLLLLLQQPLPQQQPLPVQPQLQPLLQQPQQLHVVGSLVLD